MKTLTQVMLDSLVSEAVRAPRHRQHFNLHRSHDEPVQRLFNAIGPNSYIRPHRHSADPKTELLLAVRGSFALVTFDDQGHLRDVTKVSAQRQDWTDDVIGVEVEPSEWHTVLAFGDGSVLLEVKSGPFDPYAAKELAVWAPEEGTAEGEAYFQSLLKESQKRISAEGSHS